MKKILILGLLLTLAGCASPATTDDVTVEEVMEEEGQMETTTDKAPVVESVDMQDAQEEVVEEDVATEASDIDSTMEDATMQDDGSAGDMDGDMQLDNAVVDETTTEMQETDGAESTPSGEEGMEEPVVDDSSETEATEEGEEGGEGGEGGEATTVEGDEEGAQDETTPEEVIDPVSYSVDAFDFGYSMGTINAKVGQAVTITLNNTGSGSHNWVLDEFGANSGVLSGGGSATFTFTPDKAGSFEYYCSIGSHRAMGMVGTLVVSE